MCSSMNCSLSTSALQLKKKQDIKWSMDHQKDDDVKRSVINGTHRLLPLLIITYNNIDKNNIRSSTSRFQRNMFCTCWGLSRDHIDINRYD